MMRKSTLIAGVLAATVLILAMTRERWLPPRWNDDWHEAWLISPHYQGDPRETILADHRKRVEEIEADYRKKIEEQKQLNEKLQRRLQELRETNQ